MEKVNKFEDFFGNAPIIKILDYMLSKREYDFTLSHLADATVMSRTCVRSAIGALIALKMITVTREEKASKYYGLKKDHKKFQVLIKLNDELRR
jgi:DNA-binding transcriptional regulator GbsR (MarR family)